MINRLFFSCSLFLFAFHSVSLYAKTKQPADVSYLIAEFKYSKKDGVKITEIQSAYPGILLIHKKTAAYLHDKYLMNKLFEQNDALKKYKADWRLYPKKYDARLSAKIQKDLPSEFYVIKPRTQESTTGVIVVSNHDLNTVLNIILNPSTSLEKNPNKSYSYWTKSKDPTFLIEKFYKSDYLRVAHPLTDNNAKKYGYHYDATMRITFIVENDKGKLTYHPLSGYWELPYKALEEKGTLNEKRIAYGEPPFYREADPTLLKEVNAQMERGMLLLYKTMLNGHKKT